MTTYQITFNEKTDFGKNLLVFFQDNKRQLKLKEEAKIKVKKDPTLLTKEEFYAKIDKALQQCRQGKAKRLNPEEQRKFLGLE